MNALRMIGFSWGSLSLWVAMASCVEMTSVTFPSEDGLEVTADIYLSGLPGARPVIVLFHQAGFSRGEYREIAPRLVDLGFECIAVDQRSGNQVHGVINETAKRAKEATHNTQFEDALQDMRAALRYARTQHPDSAVIGWGSSYSSSLILTISADAPELVDGTLSFSPGEYFGSIRVSQRELRPFQGRGWKPGNAIAGCQFGTIAR